MIGLVESIEEIGCTPDIENPCYDNAGCTGQQYQRKQGEDSRNDVAIGRGMREGRGQVSRYDPWHQTCHPDEAKAVEDEQRAQGFGLLTEAEFRPDISGGDHSPRDQAECDAGEKSELRLHKFLLLRFQPLRAAGGRSGLLVDWRCSLSRVGDTALAPPHFGVCGELRLRRERTAQFAVVSVQI